MDAKLQEELNNHMSLKKKAHEIVKKQRAKALVSRPKAGAPTYAENQAAIKEVIEKPVNHKKKALELFDTVITANSEKVFNKLLQKAMDDEDRDQMAALKLMTDRLAPLAKFDDSNTASGNSGKVVINISGLTAPSINGTIEGRTIDAEDVE